MRIREKNWCNSKALAQRTDCRRAMVDIREESLLHGVTDSRRTAEHRERLTKNQR